MAHAHLTPVMHSLGVKLVMNAVANSVLKDGHSKDLIVSRTAQPIRTMMHQQTLKIVLEVQLNVSSMISLDNAIHVYHHLFR